MIRCSIIIPVYGRPALVRQCLDVLLDGLSDDVDAEVIAVDDASDAETERTLASYAPRVRVLRHLVNLGFAAACNDGAQLASNEQLVFLNTDTVPCPGWLEALVRYAEVHGEAAAVGAKLLYLNGTVQHAGVVICQDHQPRHIYVGFPADHPAVNKSRRFQIITAACALVRREDFDRAGGFDVAFQNGLEDVDLCLRFNEMGREVHYCHESVLYHLESASRRSRRTVHDNLRLYQTKWAPRVKPDDLDYYAADGLLRVVYDASYPLKLGVSPLLAVLDDRREHEVDWLVNIRSRQVRELQKEVARLTIVLGEMQTGGGAWPHVGGGRVEAAAFVHPPASPGLDVASPHPAPVPEAGPVEGVLRERLVDTHRRLLDEDMEIEANIRRLQERLAAASGDGLAKHTRMFVPNQYFGYEADVRAVQERVRSELPRDAVIAVVSKGDDELLRLDCRQAWHFPANDEGEYAGYYPADSAEAIDRLEALRARGADFLLFPPCARWWLEHYTEFARYLETRYRIVVHEETCLIVSLNDRAHAT